MPATTEGQPAQGPTLEDAARIFEGLLDAESAQGNQETQSSPAANGAPADTDEGVAAEAEPQETPEETGGEAEAPEAEEAQQSAPEKGPLYTVTVDGKSERITLDEALAGYQRNQDYARKTASLANERRTMLEQAKAVSEEREQYATMLGVLRGQLQQMQDKEPDWDEVYRTDPVGYARRRDEWRDKQERITAANYELQRVHALKQKELADLRVEQIRKGREHMNKEFPAWNDPKEWDKDREALTQYAIKSGYSREEIAEAYDPRALLWGHKARLYDELMASQPKPVQQRAPRVASAGAAPDQSLATKRLNAAQQRLAKSGSLQDAAKVFEHMLNNR